MTPALADFLGRWTIARTIEDRLTGLPGRFDGTATFVAEGGAVLYAETGQLTLGAGAAVMAERRYRWSEVDGRIAVHFADGRFFHSFDPAGPAAAHWCDPDSYRVAYDFARWPDWSATWDVTGPRKDYRMVSAFRR